MKRIVMKFCFQFPADKSRLMIHRVLPRAPGGGWSTSTCAHGLAEDVHALGTYYHAICFSVANMWFHNEYLHQPILHIITQHIYTNRMCTTVCAFDFSMKYENTVIHHISFFNIYQDQNYLYLKCLWDNILNGKLDIKGKFVSSFQKHSCFHSVLCDRLLIKL